MGNRGPNGGRNLNQNNRRQNNNNNQGNNRVGQKGAIRKPMGQMRKPNVVKNNNSSKPNDSSTTDTPKNDNLRNGGAKKEDGQTNGGKELKRKNSPYSDVPNDMFYCHLCAKHMWDSTSFENHLKGRTHQMMKEGVEESYRLRANMLRQEAKISEQLKSIEIDRLKRLGKAIRAANQNREYCPMCDLQFYGHLSTHRKSDGHLELKKYLHPKCDDCTTEFHNRTEFDDHLLSPQHMKTSKTPPSYKSDESRKNRLHILTESDEILGLREEKPKKEKKEVTKEEGAEEDGEKKLNENGEPMETDATASTADAEAKTEEAKATDAAAAAEDDENEAEAANDEPEMEPILDFNEGDEIGPEIETKIPKYNCKRIVGTSLISKLVCFECRLCNKYFDTDVTAEIHSRTYNHHRLFVKFLNEKANETKIAQKRAAAAQEETERLKRVKLDEEAVPVESEVKSELYDPSEATGDDEAKEDVPMVTETSVEAVKTDKIEDVKMETVKVDEKIDDPAAAPVAVANPAATSNTPNTTPNSTPGKQNNFNNNRGRGRGNQNNNRRSGRYGGRY
ncbi:unnamed protein product [Diamesa serratosioi]